MLWSLKQLNFCDLLLRPPPAYLWQESQMRVQFQQEALLLLSLEQSISVFVFRLLNTLVQKMRHLGIFCGVNNYLFLLSFIHQTPSLLCLYLED